MAEKKGRGRPRKVKTEEELRLEAERKARGRGRPKKVKTEEELRLEAERKARSEQTEQNGAVSTMGEPAEYVPFDQLPSERDTNSEAPDSK